jgi:hypothetical protein
MKRLYTLISALLFLTPVSAQVIITPATKGENLCADGTYKHIGDIKIEEYSTSDFLQGNNLTYALGFSEPDSYEFLPGAGAIETTLNEASIEITRNNIIITYTASEASLSELDYIIIKGIQIKPSIMNSFGSPASLVRQDLNEGPVALQNGNNIIDGNAHGEISSLAALWIIDVHTQGNSSCNNTPNGKAEAYLEIGFDEGELSFHWYKGYSLSKSEPDYFGRTIQGLDEGGYTLIVKNNLTGCTSQPVTFEIKNQSSGFHLNVEPINTFIEDCHNDHGQARAYISKNDQEMTEGYTFEWYWGYDIEKEPDYVGPVQNELKVGTYSIVAVDNQTNCKSNIVNNLYINSSLWGMFEVFTNEFSCNDETTEVWLGGMSGEPLDESLTYQWYEGYQTQKEEPNFTGYENIPLQVGKYYTIIAVDENGCQTSPQNYFVNNGYNDIIFTGVNALPDSSCNNQPTGFVKAFYFDYGEFNNEILWYKGYNKIEGEPAYTGEEVYSLPEGFYTAIAKNEEGCFSFDKRTVEIKKTRQSKILQTDLLQQISTCHDQDAKAKAYIYDDFNNAELTHDYTFQWYEGAYDQDSEPIFTGSEYDQLHFGAYTVKAYENQTGCLSGAQVISINLEEGEEEEFIIVEPLQHNLAKEEAIGEAKVINPLEGKTYHWYLNKSLPANLIYATSDNYDYPPTMFNPAEKILLNELSPWGEPDVTGTEATSLPTGYHSVMVKEGFCPSLPSTVYIANLSEEPTDNPEKEILLNFYKSTNGEKWEPKVNWLEEANIQNWDGITTNNDGLVTHINLSNRNLSGTVPASVINLEALSRANFRNNNITRLDDLRAIDWEILDVRENRLEFGSLQLNMGINTEHNPNRFLFSDQKPVGRPITVHVYVNESHTLTTRVSGNNNRYRWFFENTAISEASPSPDFNLTQINRSKAGKYHCQVSNRDFPGFRLNTQPITIIPTADISGTIFNPNGEPQQDITVGLVQVPSRRSAVFERRQATKTNADGSYTLNKVPLSNYWVVAQFENYLPTYYGDELSWSNAQVLILNESVSDIDINMLKRPSRPQGQGRINGHIELGESMDEVAASRERRRAQRAGVAVYRARTAARGLIAGTHDLVDYVESNDEGEFTLNDLENGLYRLIIDFPNVPMSESAAFDIEINDEHSVVHLIAVVEEEGIILKVQEPLSNFTLKPNSLVVYPNPAKDKVIIKYPKSQSNPDFILADLTGKEISSVQVYTQSDKEELIIDLHGIKAGVYILKITLQNKVVYNYRLIVE